MTDFRLACILPAAGFARRMRGGDKLLEPVAGVPVLRRLAEAALRVSDVVCVALPALDSPRAQALEGLDVLPVAVPDADEGMGRSLSRAIAALPAGIDGILILPADMPEIGAEDLRRLAGCFAEHGARKLVQATAEDGRPGHPVIFPADCRTALSALDGDRGARDVLAANAERLVRVALPGERALTDLDTPEDWARWRAAQAASSARD